MFYINDAKPRDVVEYLDSRTLAPAAPPPFIANQPRQPTATSSVMYPRNAALDINPAAGTSRLSTSGSKWLWAVLAIHCLALVRLSPTPPRGEPLKLTDPQLAVAALGTRPPHRERILHYLFATGLLAGAVCYLAMASGLGVSAHGAYQVFFAKYVYWVVAFPVVAAALGLLSCVSWVAIMFDVVLCWAWYG